MFGKAGKTRTSQNWMRRASADAAGPSRRPVVVGAVFFGILSLMLGGLLVRVAQLQLNPPQRLVEQINRHVGEESIRGRRGSLVDRRGRPLAVMREARTLFVDTQLIEDRGLFSTLVFQQLGYHPEQIEAELAKRPGGRYVVIDRVMPNDRWQRYQDMPRIAGLATHPVTVRAYPQGSLAGQVIGFVGQEGNGLEGLELLWNDRLTATDGALAYRRDSARRPLWVVPAAYRPAHDGQTIRLSLDVTLQAMAERHLKKTLKKFNAQSGQIVVMEPYTGELLAIANAPTFDPDAPRPAGEQPERRNRAVTDVFEPGSIFKPFVWAALTEMDAADPNETIDTTDVGYYRFSFGRTLRDAHPSGSVSWETVLVKSSNIGMAKVAMRVSDKQLHDAVRRFGFGEPTGSGLPGEVGGIVTRLRDWTKYSQTSVPMGQEVATTGLQMVRAFSAIANGGLLVTPRIECLDPDDPAQAPIARRVLSPEVAYATRRVLRRTVKEGTGRRANSKLFELFGKTGTAQVPDLKNGGYLENQYVASFVAGAPVERPRLVIGCFIHRPDKSIAHYGGIVAGPTVMELMEEALLYLGEQEADDAEPDNIHLVVNRTLNVDNTATPETE